MVLHGTVAWCDSGYGIRAVYILLRFIMGERPTYLITKLSVVMGCASLQDGREFMQNMTNGVRWRHVILWQGLSIMKRNCGHEFVLSRCDSQGSEENEMHFPNIYKNVRNWALIYKRDDSGVANTTLFMRWLVVDLKLKLQSIGSMLR
jgi:hypothetical protein